MKMFRRLRKSEDGALAELCKEDLRWRGYFPDHQSWLTRALADISGPGRAVFGCFTPVPNDAGGYSLRLDACIFLKPSAFDDSAELKNLVVRGQQLKGAFDTSLAKPLIEKTIRHCEVREISKLEVELPQSEHGIISLFLELGFRVAALRERYLPGQSVCLLEKIIGETYNADPFDLIKLSKWLLRAALPSRIVQTVLRPLSNDDDDGVPCVLFESHPYHPAFSPENPLGHAKRLRGSLVILDEGDCSDANVAKIARADLLSLGPLRYVLAHELSEPAKAILKDSGITSFDLPEVCQIAGGERSSLSIPMSRSDVGGVVTALEEDLITSYSEYDEFAYYLLSGIGSALDVAAVEPSENDSEGNMLLVVFCPMWRDGRSGVVAISEIIEIAHAPFAHAFDYHPGIPRALTKEDLAYYKTRSDKDRIPVLRCSRLQVFPSALSLKDDSWHARLETRDYLTRSLDESNLVYLDLETCSSLRRHATRQVATPATKPLKAMAITAGKRMASRISTFRILFLVANPLSTPALDLEEELRGLQRELAGVKYRRYIKLSSAHAVRPDDLVRNVREHAPQVMHFSGHGSAAGIVLRHDSSNDDFEVDGESIRKFLGGRGVDLVVLNACYSHQQADAILESVQAVVGTTNVVEDEAARRFAATFYRSLGNDCSVGEAFKDGMDALTLYKLNEDVYYCRGNRDLRLLRRTATPP